MAIRNTAKAIIIKDGCVLLNKCAHRNGTPMYLGTKLIDDPAE